MLAGSEERNYRDIDELSLDIFVCLRFYITSELATVEGIAEMAAHFGPNTVILSISLRKSRDTLIHQLEVTAIRLAIDVCTIWKIFLNFCR